MSDKIIISKDRAAFEAILENIEKYGTNFQEARDKIDQLQSELASVKEEIEREREKFNGLLAAATKLVDHREWDNVKVSPVLGVKMYDFIVAVDKYRKEE